MGISFVLGRVLSTVGGYNQYYGGYNQYYGGYNQYYGGGGILTVHRGVYSTVGISFVLGRVFSIVASLGNPAPKKAANERKWQYIASKKMHQAPKVGQIAQRRMLLAH